jgi:hypothetical protein
MMLNAFSKIKISYIVLIGLGSSIAFPAAAQVNQVANQLNNVDLTTVPATFPSSFPQALPVAPIGLPLNPPEDATQVVPVIPDPSQPRIDEYKSVDPAVPSFNPVSVDLDFRHRVGSDNKVTRIFEPSAQFQLRQGGQFKLTTGANFFQQDGVDAIANYPLRFGWQNKVGEAKVSASVGVDFFDDLPAVPNFNAQIDMPFGAEVNRLGQLSRLVVVSTAFDYGAYKFSAKSLRTGVTAAQIKPSIYWQITPSTNLYAHYQLGFFNDGNTEQQVFGRLQQKLGSEFFVAANLFSWSFAKDAETKSGYFSPSDFLTYTGEIGWEGKVVNDRLQCRLSTAFGRQRNRGNYSGASTYNARCQVGLSPDLALELGYSLSNIRDRGNANDFRTQEISGKLKYRFD